MIEFGSSGFRMLNKTVGKFSFAPEVSIMDAEEEEMLLSSKARTASFPKPSP